jgi:transketolase
MKEHEHNSAKAVYTLPLWGMAVKSKQEVQVCNWGMIETLEDHLADGGMGAWLLESIVLKPDLRSRVKLRCLDANVCGTVGSQAVLNSYGGL